jgi:hypothetical protein
MKRLEACGHVWWINEEGKIHRLGGPAFEHTDGTREWWVDCNRHRLDGPAVEWSSGGSQWWVNGERMMQEEFNKHPLVIFWRLAQESMK